MSDPSIHLRIAWVSMCCCLGYYNASGEVLTVCPTDCTYTRISDAIFQSRDGDTIEVEAGEYHEGIAFFGKKITVRAVNGPANTIINADNAITAVQFLEGEGADTVIDGFTITNGFSQSGGGIGCDDSSPTVRNCIIRENHSESDGAGIVLIGSSPTFSNCIITENETTGDDGGGFAILFESFPIVTDCIISKNVSPSDGGGFYISANSSPEIRRCLIMGNSAAGQGGGIWYHGSDYTLLINSIVSGNVAGGSGGGIYYNEMKEPRIVHSTISGNRALSGGGIFHRSLDPALLVLNSIVYGNRGEEYSDASVETFNQQLRFDRFSENPPVVDHSNIEGGDPSKDFERIWVDLDTIDLDPEFKNPKPASESPTDEGDYNLSDSSPCIDRGSNDILNYGFLPVQDREGDIRPYLQGRDIGADEVLNFNLNSWIAVFFSQAERNNPEKESTVWGLHADPDGDLHVNLAEYFFGLNPLVKDGNPVIQAWNDAGILRAGYRRSNGINQYHGVLEYSTDLVTWNGDGIDETMVELDNNQIEIEATFPELNGEPAAFVHLVIKDEE